MGNLERLRTRMKELGVSSILVSDNANVQWLTGFTGSAGCVVLTQSDAMFITDSRYAIQAVEQVTSMPVRSFASPVKMVDVIAEQAKAFGLTQLGFESASVTYQTFEEWQAAFAGIQLNGVRRLFEPVRMVKLEDEIVKTRAACRLADACFDHVIRMIQPGVREYDIALDIEFYFRRNGAELAFDPIVVSGPNSARPHGKPGERVLQRGDFVTMDFGAKLNGYCSDLTRTVVVEEASDRHVEIYEQVLKAETESILAIRPGKTGHEIDALARSILDEKGLAQHFGHGLGHGLGKVVHDFGGLRPGSEDILEVGQIWTVEPGVYIEGFGGVRIEDDIVVTPDGAEVLTHSPKELMVLPRRA